MNFSPQGTPATLTAVVTSYGLVGGQANGLIQFTDDSTKATSTCAAVEILFQPFPPHFTIGRLISHK